MTDDTLRDDTPRDMTDGLDRLAEACDTLLGHLLDSSTIDTDEIDTLDQAYRLGVSAARSTLRAWITDAEHWRDLDSHDEADVVARVHDFCGNVCPASRVLPPGDDDTCGRCPLFSITVEPTRLAVAGIGTDEERGE